MADPSSVIAAGENQSMVHSRPPKPVPFGGYTTTSSSSRENLRREVHRKRNSLTAKEHSFLKQLASSGNEGEIVCATERLADEVIFFSTDQVECKLDGDFQAQRPLPVQRAGSNASIASVSSEKRLESLEKRRKSLMHEKIWKAHDSGLAITNQGSQKSVLQRGSSFSGRLETLRRLSVSGTKEAKEPVGGIFRPTQVRRNSASGRTRSWTRDDWAQRSNLLKPNRVRRLKSEGTQRSVSFKDDVAMNTNSERSTRSAFMSRRPYRKSDPDSVPEAPPPPIPKPVAIQRGSSLSSVPSIHRAHPIRSDSMSSVPSIHHAHLVRGDSSSSGYQRQGSMSSIPSLHRARALRSDSITGSFIGFDDVREDSESFPHDILIPTKPEAVSRFPSEESKIERPVMVRRASRNVYNGEGLEVTDLDIFDVSAEDIAPVGDQNNGWTPILEAASFDETKSYERFRASGIFRGIPTCLSDDEMAGIFLGPSKALLWDSITAISQQTDGDSWDLESENGPFDGWDAIKDDYVNGYGGGGTLSFRILGTSGDDPAAEPHVLSPPLMESLQSFMPFSLTASNYWMKYSLVKDGASLYTLLQYARGARYTVLALETVDGEVFGSFTSSTWRKNWNFYGSGESFLWRMRQSRREKCSSIIDQARMESEIEVFPYTGENNYIQLCTDNRLAIGGGSLDEEEKAESPIKAQDFGFGLSLEGDLLHGTTSACVTFRNPSLSKVHSDGSPFEVLNLELWTLTPCDTLEDAEKLEFERLFLEK